MKYTKVVILGSTGSVGKNTVAVVRQLPGFRVLGLTGHSQIDLLREHARLCQPEHVVISDAGSLEGNGDQEWGECQVGFGTSAVNELASHPDCDIVVAAIVGAAGLESTWQAVAHGKRVALANKEALVVAGNQICQLAKLSGAEIIPVDSEHSAIFQCLHTGQTSEVERIVLTASGGPFRDLDSSQLSLVTVQQALAHPTWEMGKKISIDSATMMNKAMEIVEARWLFDVLPEQITVVVHPQSIVHSLVEFVDGSVMAQMSPPDMRLPIQYALTYPKRIASSSPRFDWKSHLSLQFFAADPERYPALQLGYEVAGRGGTTGAVLNAANEAAVAAFLQREISFTDIVTACREILNHHHYDPNPDLPQLLAVDRWAREEINKWITC